MQEGPESKQEENKFVTVTRSGRVSRPPAIFGITDIGTTATQKNYYAALVELCKEETRQFEDAPYKVAAVGAVLGGRFAHTSELRVIK